MEVDVVGHGQSNGKRVTNEMNVMTARRKFLPQFSCNHTATTISRVAGDPDLHIWMT